MKHVRIGGKDYIVAMGEDVDLDVSFIHGTGAFPQQDYTAGQNMGIFLVRRPLHTNIPEVMHGRHCNANGVAYKEVGMLGRWANSSNAPLMQWVDNKDGTFSFTAIRDIKGRGSTRGLANELTFHYWGFYQHLGGILYAEA